MAQHFFLTLASSDVDVDDEDFFQASLPKMDVLDRDVARLWRVNRTIHELVRDRVSDVVLWASMKATKGLIIEATYP